jgi:hypothetical protein
MVSGYETALDYFLPGNLEKVNLYASVSSSMKIAVITFRVFLRMKSLMYESTKNNTW